MDGNGTVADATEVAPIIERVAANPVIIFKEPKTVPELYAALKEQVAAFQVPSMDTQKGRDEVRSFAMNITKTKTTLDAARKDLTEEWRKETARVNAVWKDLEANLVDLAKAVRKPLTDWEEADKARQARCEEILTEIRQAVIVGPSVTSGEIEARLTQLRGLDMSGFAEGGERKVADVTLSNAIDTLTETKAMVEKAEADRLQAERDRAELEAMRREKAEREAAEAAAAEAKAKAEAAAKAEAERVERAAAEAKKRAEEEEAKAKRLEAEAKAKAEAEAKAKIDAEFARLKREAAEQAAAAQKAIDDAEAARKAEEAAAKAAADEAAAKEAKRQANTRLRNKAAAEIAKALEEQCGVGSISHEIAMALIDGKIPRVTVAI